MTNMIVHEEVPDSDGFVMDALAMDASSFSLMAEPEFHGHSREDASAMQIRQHFPKLNTRMGVEVFPDRFCTRKDE